MPRESNKSKSSIPSSPKKKYQVHYNRRKTQARYSNHQTTTIYKPKLEPYFFFGKGANKLLHSPRSKHARCQTLSYLDERIIKIEQLNH